MDQKHISLPLRDLSKMFDSVNHLIFLKKYLNNVMLRLAGLIIIKKTENNQYVLMTLSVSYYPSHTVLHKPLSWDLYFI